MKTTPTRWMLPRLVLAATLAAVIGTVPSDALSITRDEVITLTKLGISPDEVIKAIEKDKTTFTLSVTDILMLKKSGVDEKVLKFMLATPRLYGKKDGDPGVGEVKPVEPVEKEETPEERKAREERMRQEAIKLMEEKRSAEEAQRKAFAKGVMARGRKLADEGKFVESIQAFQKFVDQGGFAPDSEEAYMAKFGMANALVKANLYQSAAKELVEVLLEGAERPFFQTAFKQLRQLRRKVNYSPPNLQQLTKFFVGNFSKSFQDEYNYVLGEFFYDYKNMTEAMKYLEAVSPDAKDYGKAQYLKGLVEVQNQLIKSAVGSFQRAILATEENNSDPEVMDLAFLALARIAYEVGDPDAAIYYYRKVPSLSYKRAMALYESAWVYFVKGDYSRSLGTFQTLHSPYFSHYFFPELWILEATIYMNLCRFDYAEIALEQWTKDIAPLMLPLKEFLLKTVRPEEYYNALIQTVSGKESFGLPKTLTSVVLSNVEFFNLYQTIKQIQREVDIMSRRGAELGAKGAEIQDKLAKIQDNRIRDIGINIQRILKEIEGSLADYDIKFKEIEVDLQDQKLEAEAEALRALSGDVAPKKPVVAEAGGSIAIVGSDSWEWPFEGEYWEDEIGFHRAFVNDLCPREDEE